MGYFDDFPYYDRFLVTALLALSLRGETSHAQTLGAGDIFSYATCPDFTFWTWGSDLSGQLGNGLPLAQVWSPVQVTPPLTGMISVGDGGWKHVLGIKNDGTVWAWGENGNGQLGDGTTTDKNVPVQVSGLTGITITAAAGGGNNHSLFLDNTGAVWACGNNSTGKLGDGTTTSALVPVQVTGLTGITITAIHAGYYHSLALDNTGAVWAWGNNLYGQLGNGTTAGSLVPVQVTGLTGITAIDAGNYHSMALKNDGTVWTWGYGLYGQMGNGTTTTFNPVPIQVASLSGMIAVTAAYLSCLAVKNDGTVWTWGYNYAGQLGDNTMVQQNTPVQVHGPANVGFLTGITAAVVGGGSHYLAVKNDGTVWGWGANAQGQLGDGSWVNRTTPVQTAGLCSFVPLPIELLFFEGHNENHQVKLNWETVSEMNNDHFVVERSMDNIEFKEIGKVRGSGSSTNARSYSFVDERPYKGTNYYRLNQVDYDGRVTDSKLISVKTYIQRMTLNAYLGPANKELNCELALEESGMVNVSIFDMFGNKVMNESMNSVKGENNFKMNIGNLTQGMYFLKIQNEILQTQIKFVKQ